MTTMMIISTILTILTMMTILKMITISILDHDELMTIHFVRKLEVVHKEVGGCTQGSWRLSDQMRIAASIAQIDDESLTHSVTQSVTYVGIELLGQLKIQILQLVLIFLKLGSTAITQIRPPGAMSKNKPIKSEGFHFRYEDIIRPGPGQLLTTNEWH